MYPEHEKLEAVRERSQEIGDFLEWLDGEPKIVLCKWHEAYIETMDDPDGKSAFNPSGKIRNYDPARYTPANENTEKLLAQYFEIDLDVLEEEKRTMLTELRST